MNVMLPLRDLMIYPDSDGLPTSDNTRQGDWIILLFTNLSALFREQMNVFIAQNLLWYAVEGRPDIRAAPDVFVVFGRPKGYRGSYKQWEEDNLPPTVAFEILSPGNSATAMDLKYLFYEDHGVEEYYLFDPDTNHLQVYVRQGSVLRRQRPAHDFVSPRLGVRFDLSREEMVVWKPNGERFLTFNEAEDARVKDRFQADQAERRASDAALRLARVVELGRKVRQGQASPEELQELERLEEMPPP